MKKFCIFNPSVIPGDRFRDKPIKDFGRETRSFASFELKKSWKNDRFASVSAIPNIDFPVNMTTSSVATVSIGQQYTGWLAPFR